MTASEDLLVNVLLEVFKTKGRAAPQMGPDTVLEQLGLESLDFAQAVIRLEELTGLDPFAGDGEYQIRTVADFAALYA